MSAYRRVAFQGERGAFSEEAALKLLGPQVELLPCRTLEDIFEAVTAGPADACLAPVENSLAGSVYETYDLLLEKELRIVAEVNLPIVHHLLVLPGVRLAELRRVYSHPVALAQCRRFLSQHPEWEVLPAYDTAGSAKRVAEERLADAGAIASRLAAERYALDVLAEAIQDHRENYTRFLLLAPGEQVAAGANKTSVVFSVPHEPGSLFRSLSVFALRSLNLTRIESRPLRGRPWEYFFYIDFLGGMQEERCQNAINHLREMAEFVKVLGSYPKAEG